MIKTITQKNKCKKAKWLSEETLQITMKRRKVNDPIDGSPFGSSVSQSSDIKNKKIGIWRSVRRLSEVRAAFSPPCLPQLPVQRGMLAQPLEPRPGERGFPGTTEREK